MGQIWCAVVVRVARRGRTDENCDVIVSAKLTRPAPVARRTRILANMPSRASKLTRQKAASLSVVDSWCAPLRSVLLEAAGPILRRA